MAQENAEAKRKAIEALAQAVSKKVSPTTEEAAREKAFAKSLMQKLNAALGGEAEINFVGSAARDTGLAGDKDIDLFIAFPRSREREYIIKKTINATKTAIKAGWEMHYAEHPYLRAVVSGFEVEVIPCFKIKPHEQIKSAVDRSPLHMKYLQEKLTAAQRRDVRVLKKMMKNAGIYGAEIEVEGFSGLVCEQMMLNHRSLAGIIEAAKAWRPPVIIDLEGAYEGESGKQELLKKFPDSALILVDAIDRNRNAAAAVSVTSASKFVTLCRAFWRRPSMEFFFRKQPTPSPAAIKKAAASREHSLFLLQMDKPKDIVSDILVPQLRKSASSLARHLELADFQVYDQHSFATENDCFMLFELEADCLAPVKRVRGPPVSDAKACENFIAAHEAEDWMRGPYIEGGFIVVEKERKLIRARDAFKQIVAKPSTYGTASHFVKPLSKAKVFEGKEIARSKAFSKEALPALGHFIFRRDWWLD